MNTSPLPRFQCYTLMNDDDVTHNHFWEVDPAIQNLFLGFVLEASRHSYVNDFQVISIDAVSLDFVLPLSSDIPDVH